MSKNARCKRQRPGTVWPCCLLQILEQSNKRASAKIAMNDQENIERAAKFASLPEGLRREYYNSPLIHSWISAYLHERIDRETCLAGLAEALAVRLADQFSVNCPRRVCFGLFSPQSRKSKRFKFNRLTHIQRAASALSDLFWQRSRCLNNLGWDYFGTHRIIFTLSKFPARQKA